MNHTPGPWASLTRIGSADSRLHATLNDDASDAYVIVAAADPDEEAANARLIAAAPDLLLHLQRLVRAIDRAPANFADGLADEARAAIAAAKGQA